MLQHGLIETVGPYLRLTPYGAEHLDGVVALFYAGAVKEYLVHLADGEYRMAGEIGD